MISIFLVGFRASGKTSIGEKVAEILNIPFYDLDQIFEKRFGSISEYVAQHDWESFRKKESAILLEHKTIPAIFSTGGGVIELEKNRILLKQTRTIFVNTSLGIITNRLSSMENNRPQLLPEVSQEDEIIQTYKKRLHWYREVSQFQFVPTGNLENDAKKLAEKINLEH